MKLKSFGCSFIFGTDLHDDGRDGTYATPSQYTWPSLLAQHLGYEYKCFARPGSGNLQILERLLNNIQEDDPALYVIGWTWIDRFDYIDLNLKTPWPGAKWNTIMPISESSLAKVYYKQLHSQYTDKLKTLTYIKTAIESLRAKKCQFIMTYMDDLIFCKQWHFSPAINLIMEDIRPYVHQFNGQNFLDWSKSQGYEISNMLHPLETAHRAAADLIINNLCSWIKN